MATVALNAYDQFRLAQWKGTSPVNFAADTIKAALVTSAYTPDQNLNDFWDDVVATEVSGSNYTAGGKAMANPTVTMSVAGLITIDTDDPASWLQHATGFSTARRVIVYKATGVNATSTLIGYSDAFAADKGNVDGDFEVLTTNDLYTQAR